MQQRKEREEPALEVSVSGPVVAHYAQDLLRGLRIQRLDNIAQMGAGSRDFALAAARAGASVTVLDTSVDALETLRARAKAEGLGNIQAKYLNTATLSGARNKYEKAVAFLPVIGPADRASSFRVMYRMLKLGGIAAFVTWKIPDLERLFMAYLSILPGTGIQKPSKRPLSLSEQVTIEREFVKAGFRDFYMKSTALVWRANSPPELWDAMRDTVTDVGSLSSVAGPEHLELLRRLFISALSREQKGGPAELRGETLIGLGVK